MRVFALASIAFLALANCADTSDLRSLPPGPAPATLRGIDPNLSYEAELPAISRFCATFVDEKRATDELAKAGYEFQQNKYSYVYTLFNSKANKLLDQPAIEVDAGSSRPKNWDCKMFMPAREEDGVKVVRSFKQEMVKKGWKPVDGSLTQFTKNGRTAEISGKAARTGSGTLVWVWIRDWN